jgi:glucose-6-phosphate 1-epimerase
VRYPQLRTRLGFSLLRPARRKIPAMATVQELSGQFSVPDRVSFVKGDGGMTRVVLSTPRSEAHVYLHGAHVSHFARTGERPVLFMSKQSLFQVDKAIRGGVPLCFPWFGPRAAHPESPMHGFARTSEWAVESTSGKGDTTTVTLVLKSSPETQKLWPHNFLARYTITLSDTLALALEVVNTGQSPITFEEALHTYFTISNIKDITIEGLGGVDYIDKTDGMAVKTQGSKPMKLAEETDRIYLPTSAANTIRDPGLKRRIVNSKENSDTTVVWNPWTAKAKAMADFGDDEWLTMICIETCNVNKHAITLNAGASHMMKATIATQPL